MADRPEPHPTDQDENPVRRAAFRGALLASALLTAVAAARHQLDGWMVATAVGAVALSGLALARPRWRREASVTPKEGAAHRPGNAEALLATIPDPIILVDRRSVVVEMNEAARALLPGLKLKNPLSFALRSPDVLDGIEEVLRTGEVRRVEYSERVPTERAFEVQIGPLRKEAPQDGVALFFRDLTAARRLEHMRVDFVANASHELRTPLASLLGFIETLQGPARNDPKARDRFLEIMRAQARRMTRLIDDLLSLSRIEMRAHLAPDTPVELDPIVTQIADALGPMARERGVEIRWIAPDRPLRVLGDKDELLRVVENLVENAVKYGEAGGKVDIALASRPGPGEGPDRVELSVRDYGPGIAPEHLPRLTERFYRADAAESRDKGGTGLGLAIVKHIVNRHRGQLAIESEPGEGALFRVTLPGTNDHTGVMP